MMLVITTATRPAWLLRQTSQQHTRVKAVKQRNQGRLPARVPLTLTVTQTAQLLSGGNRCASGAVTAAHLARRHTADKKMSSRRILRHIASPGKALVTRLLH